MKITPEFTQLDPTAFDRYFYNADRKSSVELYAKISNIFLKNIAARIELLSKSLDNSENREAIVVAHQLKGLLLSLGGTQLAEIFRRIELEIDELPLLELKTILKNAESDLVAFIRELEDWNKLLTNLD